MSDEATHKATVGKIQRLQKGILLAKGEDGTSPLSRVAQVIEHPPENTPPLNPDLIAAVRLLQKPVASDTTVAGLASFHDALTRVLSKSEGAGSVKGVTTVIKAERKELGTALDPLYNLLGGQEVTDDKVDHAVSRAAEVAERRAQRLREADTVDLEAVRDAAREKEARKRGGIGSDDDDVEPNGAEALLNIMGRRGASGRKPQGLEFEILIPEKEVRPTKKQTQSKTPRFAPPKQDQYMLATIPPFELAALAKLDDELGAELKTQRAELEKYYQQMAEFIELKKLTDGAAPNTDAPAAPNSLLQQVQGFIDDAKLAKTPTPLQTKILDKYQELMSQPESSPETASAQLPREMVIAIAVDQAKGGRPDKRNAAQNALLKITPQVEALEKRANSYERVVEALNILTAPAETPDTPKKLTMKEFGLAYAALVKLDNYPTDLQTKMRETMGLKNIGDKQKSVATTMMDVVRNGTGMNGDTFVRMPYELLEGALEALPGGPPKGFATRTVRRDPIVSGIAS